MTLEEYKNKLNDIVENPETAATAVLDLQGELEKDFGDHETLVTELENAKKQLNDASEQNKTLFRRLTGQAPREEEHTAEKDLVDELLKDSLRSY